MNNFRYFFPSSLIFSVEYQLQKMIFIICIELFQTRTSRSDFLSYGYPHFTCDYIKFNWFHHLISVFDVRHIKTKSIRLKTHKRHVITILFTDKNVLKYNDYKYPIDYSYIVNINISNFSVIYIISDTPIWLFYKFLSQNSFTR
jgi:hypothetical protein